MRFKLKTSAFLKKLRKTRTNRQKRMDWSRANVNMSSCNERSVHSIVFLPRLLFTQSWVAFSRSCSYKHQRKHPSLVNKKVAGKSVKQGVQSFLLTMAREHFAFFVVWWGKRGVVTLALVEKKVVLGKVTELISVSSAYALHSPLVAFGRSYSHSTFPPFVQTYIHFTY